MPALRTCRTSLAVPGLDLDRARAAVHRLLHSEPKILHEVPGSGPTDPGPTYELAPRT